MNVDRNKFPTERDDCFVSALQVLSTPAGHYLGRTCWDKEHGFESAYSRETDYMTEAQAEQALATGRYEVRDCAENDLAYAQGLPHPKGLPASAFTEKVAEESVRFQQLMDSV